MGGVDHRTGEHQARAGWVLGVAEWSPDLCHRVAGAPQAWSKRILGAAGRRAPQAEKTALPFACCTVAWDSVRVQRGEELSTPKRSVADASRPDAYT